MRNRPILLMTTRATALLSPSWDPALGFSRVAEMWTDHKSHRDTDPAYQIHGASWEVNGVPYMYVICRSPLTWWTQYAADFIGHEPYEAHRILFQLGSRR